MVGKVTLSLIAAECGVTQPTVSRILNGKADSYLPETVKLVQSTAQRLGYRRNNMAKNMRTGKTFTLTMALDIVNGRSSLPEELLRGINNAIAASGYSLSLSPVSEEKNQIKHFVDRVLKELVTDGLLINFHGSTPDDLPDILESYRIPAVWINSSRIANNFRPDDYKAGYDLTKKFIDIGHKRIVYLSAHYYCDHPHYSKTDRHDGYLAAMKENNLTSESILMEYPQNNPSQILEYAAKQLNGATAVVAYSNLDLEILLLNKKRKALSSISDYGTFGTQYQLWSLPVHKMILPFEEIGFAAVRSLLDIISSENRETRNPAQLFQCDYLNHSGYYR